MSGAGIAVHGLNTGGGYGVKGISNQGSPGATLVGVYGESVVPDGEFAFGVSVKGKGGEIGVFGEGFAGIVGSGGVGVEGRGTSFAGVYGTGINFSVAGVLGESAASNGVQGKSTSSTASGVYGENFAGGYGVAGRANGAFVHIQNSTVNNSAVGMQGGRQVINIVNWANRFIIAHELGHALGLEHEHTRRDRTGFVRINYNNVCKATDTSCNGGFCLDANGNRIDCDFAFDTNSTSQV